MERELFYEAVKGLRSAIPASEGSVELGFMALISLKSQLSDGAKLLLSSCFSVSAGCDGNRYLSLVLVDNSSKPIIYVDEVIAVANAAQYLKSIEKKFLFYVFKTYNFKLDVPPESIITFMPRKRKS